MHPQSTEHTSPVPGPSYFKAVDDLQEAVGEVISRCFDDPRGWIANAAAKSGALAAEQDKLRRLDVSAPVAADPRRRVYEVITDGIAAGLPLPASIEIPGHYDLATIRMPRNDKAGVDVWTSYLNLPAPKLDEPLDTGVSPYGVNLEDLSAVPGWHITVHCFCTEGGAQ